MDCLFIYRACIRDASTRITRSILRTADDLSAIVTDVAQRKVVQYVAYGDNFDLESGHGSHVAGIAAGSNVSQGCSGVAGEHPCSSDGDGIAFGAKLAIFDGADSTGALTLPANLQDYVFSVAYSAGARVQSNSWGASTFSTYSYLDW